MSPPAPIINGVHPENPPEDYPIFDTIYRNLNLEINFNSGILLGAGFISELYIHMGFHPAWKFETVIELIFKNEFVTEIRNVSERISEIRNNMIKKLFNGNNFNDSESLKKWIESTFRLDYHL